MEKVMLEVEVRTVYGKDLIYPVGPAPVAQAVRMLVCKQTVDDDDLVNLRTLGVQVKEVFKSKIGGAA